MNFTTYEKEKQANVDWLKDVPEHWDAIRLKYRSSINDEKLHEDTDPSFELNYVDIGSVNNVDGIQKTEEMVFEDAPSRARRIVRDGDTIVSTVRTYLKAIAHIEDPKDKLIASTGFAVIRPDEIEPRYLSYALRDDRFVNQVVSRSVGVSYPACNATDIADISIAAGTSEEQEQIARFLDVSVGKIDTLVSKKRELIELLQEKRRALVSRCVTRGLPPDAARAAGLDPQPKLKPSGVDWLGDVPEHWDVIALKHLVSRPIIDGPHVSPEKIDEGIPFVSAESIGKGFVDFDKKWGCISPEDHELYSKRYKPQRDDILLVKLGATTGVPAIVETDIEFNIMVPLAAIRLREGIHARFIFHVLGSNNLRDAYEVNWTYGTQQTLGLRTISNLRMPMPPSEERKEIVRFLDSKLPSFDSLEVKAEEAIEYLLEYRSALITAAVTGKIDVREVEV